MFEEELFKGAQLCGEICVSLQGISALISSESIKE